MPKLDILLDYFNEISKGNQDDTLDLSESTINPGYRTYNAPRQYFAENPEKALDIYSVL